MFCAGLRRSEIAALVWERHHADGARRAVCGSASGGLGAEPVTREAMVYYVVALGLFRSVSAREVLRCLMEGLRWVG